MIHTKMIHTNNDQNHQNPTTNSNRIGEGVVKESEEFRSQASDVGLDFVREGSTILIHSYSRLVLLLLKRVCGIRAANTELVEVFVASVKIYYHNNTANLTTIIITQIIP
jgi:translation initiation factor 2B subunit (eIF-2B alpha/beta/delta family)